MEKARRRCEGHRRGSRGQAAAREAMTYYLSMATRAEDRKHVAELRIMRRITIIRGSPPMTSRPGYYFFLAADSARPVRGPCSGAGCDL